MPFWHLDNEKNLVRNLFVDFDTKSTGNRLTKF